MKEHQCYTHTHSMTLFLTMIPKHKTISAWAVVIWRRRILGCPCPSTFLRHLHARTHVSHPTVNPFTLTLQTSQSFANMISSQGSHQKYMQHINLLRIKKHHYSYSLLSRMQNGIVTLEGSLAIAYKTKHTLNHKTQQWCCFVFNQTRWKLTSTQKPAHECL